MKTILLSIFVSFCMMGLIQAQELPTVNVTTLELQNISTATFDNDGNPIIISFWATWCKPCVKELNAIAEVYEDWQDETGVKVIAISIDDARNAQRVKPFVNGRDWPFEVYLDQNSDFKRAMNVVNVPHTFLLDGSLHIHSQHTSYAPGDEEELYDEVVELKAEEDDSDGDEDEDEDEDED